MKRNPHLVEEAEQSMRFASVFWNLVNIRWCFLDDLLKHGALGRFCVHRYGHSLGLTGMIPGLI